MKKSLLSIVFCIAVLTQTMAQNVPNGGMEDWEINQHGGLEPVSWVTLNDDVFTSVFQEPGYQGEYAAKLSVEWDPVLEMFVGPMFFHDGNFNVSERFTALSFFLQGTAAGTDYLSVNVGMYKEGVLIGFAIEHFNQTYTEWTEISLEITYENNEVPDEAFIGIQVYPLMNATYGTYYTLDELNLNMGSGSTNPVLLSAITNTEGTAFELTFSMPMANPAGAHNQFSGKRNGNTIGFTSASLKSGYDHTIVLTLAEPVVASDVLKVSYTAGTVTAASGEPLESFTDHPVINLVGGGGPGAWQIVPSGVSTDLYSVHFANNSTGYIGGAMATCLKSTNEGFSWTSLSIPSFIDFRSVYATTASDAYVAAWDTIYATHNGGQSWTGGHTQTLNFTIFDLHFTTPNNGIAFMDVSAVTRTTDAGNTWSEWTGAGVIESFFDGYMIDGNTGFAVGDCGLIAKTTDGGDTWIQYDWNYWTEWSCIQIWGVHFTSALNGFAAADSGVVFRTTDGGNTWSRSVIAGPDDKLTAVNFVNPATGYITGFNGKIFKTNDGGANWVQEPAITSNDLHDVFFISENLGWAVGNNGTILRFGNSSISVSEPDVEDFGLVNIFPNPFSSRASLAFNLTEKSEVQIDIYDLSGRHVIQVFKGTLVPGAQFQELDMTEFKNGVYFCRISHSAGSVCKPFVISK
jgi:photosystem II stability/assembly factor-like uncharacterized protein